MQKERAIDLSLIRPIETNTPALKGKITLKKLFKEYLSKLNVGFHDPCCGDNATCPPISSAPLNVVQCNSDGLYVAYQDAGGTGSVTSVGLTMPSAFSVSGSPITTTGVFAITAIGNTSQYIRGDGSLALFPTEFTTLYSGDGAIIAPRAIDVQNFSVTWNNTGLFRILEGNSTTGGTYDFNEGIDFLAHDANNSSNLVLNSISGLSFEYSDVVLPAILSSLNVNATGIKFTGIQEFTDNAAAITGGLTVGYVYRTGDNLKIVH